MLTVYHNLKGSDMEYWLHLQTAMRSDREITIDHADLQPVAQIDESPESDSLKAIYDLLNRGCDGTTSENVPWWKLQTPGVMKLGDSEYRSTAVGDVIEINGKFWLVATIGFRECIVQAKSDTK